MGDTVDSEVINVISTKEKSIHAFSDIVPIRPKAQLFFFYSFSVYCSANIHNSLC